MIIKDIVILCYFILYLDVTYDDYGHHQGGYTRNEIKAKARAKETFDDNFGESIHDWDQDNYDQDCENDDWDQDSYDDDEIEDESPSVKDASNQTHRKQLCGNSIYFCNERKKKKKKSNCFSFFIFSFFFLFFLFFLVLLFYYLFIKYCTIILIIIYFKCYQ